MYSSPRAAALLLTLSWSLTLGGCGSWSNPIDSLRPFKIDIQQGNVISQDMLDKLKPGMTPAQVRFILGTPLIADPFHPERWDYVYRHSKAGQLTEQRKVSVLFEQDKLKGVVGDVVPSSPSGGEGAAGADSSAKPAPVQNGGGQ